MKFLILVLATLNVQGADFWLLSTKKEPPPAQPQVTLCEFFIGGAVLVVGGVMVYKICTANFWTNIPPPPTNPPPPPATNNTATNNPSTNKPPCKWFPFHLFSHSSSNRANLSVTNQPTWLYGTNMQFTSPDGITFNGYVRGLFPLQQSSDLVNWLPWQFDCWANPSNILYVVFDGLGNPVETNLTTPDATDTIDGCWASEPKMFFRFQQ